jgi:hypothetical protein
MAVNYSKRALSSHPEAVYVTWGTNVMGTSCE